MWPDTHVSDTVLKVAVAELRRVLGDRPRSPRFIETVHRRGYRFIGEIESEGTEGAAAGCQQSPASRVVGRDQALLELRHHLDAARARERRAVLVTGEPGIGKTALIEAFVDSQATESLSIAWGQCRESYGHVATALAVVKEALRQALDFPRHLRLDDRGKSPTFMSRTRRVLAGGFGLTERFRSCNSFGDLRRSGVSGWVGSEECHVQGGVDPGSRRDCLV